MTKGKQGQTCAQAIKFCFSNVVGPLSYTQIFNQVRTQGDWKETTVWRYLMSTVVNLIQARHEWPSTEKFLFLRPDGQYERYNSVIHGIPIEK